ncbi:hypothetical protein LRP30_33910 [Bradyrhizobium sp. C-145]|uniref:hypothetical protein n=1 Tax=Bradyrhizobium sp. C-145 TaxID=574727 RepID=UPI00201B5244|nr:hypothetical protein [Bradyrhizobium sp. C-145]UQR61758.1 hypothetical protein LRP30_33910 [Bradyrhizobium sp. C-145]
MMAVAALSIEETANEVARALVRVTARDQGVRLALPLLYPGGAMVGVEISRLRNGFLVSDTGSARREAGLLGGERAFQRIAVEVAKRFGIRFDHNMIFDLDVPEDHLVPAVMAVANAAKTAVENTALHLATTEHADHRAFLWDRLQSVFGSSFSREPVSFNGASSESYDFDAAVKAQGHLTLFQVVTPNANSVNSAVTKFLDVRDLGDTAPHRVSVVTNKDRTPRLLVLGRTSRILPVDATDDQYRLAA